MINNEPLHIKSKPSPLGFSLRNIELIMLFWDFIIFIPLMNISIFIYLIFLTSLFAFIFIGRKRGKFINSGLEYFVYKDRIELYSGGELYRRYYIENSSISVERKPFGVNIVLKKGISSYFGSDSVAGFYNDLRKNSYEFLIYNCPDHEKVLAYLNSQKNK